MLDAMRRGALNIVAKLLLGLLIVAFAFWGIPNVFRETGRGTLAKVGDTSISADEYRQAYQDEMSSISRRLGRRLTAEQAKMLGVEQRTLSRLIGIAAIDQHARELRLALSDKGIADIISEDPAFQDVNGKFSRDSFRAILRQNGYTEGRYVDSRRREEVRDQLTETLLAGVNVPRLMIDLLHRYNDETRVIEFLVPDYDKLIKPVPPDEAKLKEYYEQNKRQFVTPELRKVNVLLITRDDVKSRLPISDDDVKTAYEQNKDKYDIAEKRHIEQLAFPDKAAAEKAYGELAGATNFTEAATNLGFKQSDIDLGVLTRKDMIDPKIAEAAFALPKGELSKPVEGQFSVVLLRVTDVVPGKQRSFDEVKGEIKDRLAEERAGQEIQDLHEKVEKERSAGKTLKEIGTALNLPFREIAEISRDGKAGDGKPAIASGEAAKIGQAAFAGAVGLEAEAADLADGGFAWVDVIAVTPEKQKSIEDVKAEVEAGALEQQRRREIAAAAAKLVERLSGGETMEAMAAELGAKLERTPAVTRNTSPQGLPQLAVQQAFTLPKGGAIAAPSADGKTRIVLRVADITPAPPATPEQINRLTTELTRQLQSDVLAEYIAGLQARYGMSVNDAALKQALSGGSGREQPDYE